MPAGSLLYSADGGQVSHDRRSTWSAVAALTAALALFSLSSVTSAQASGSALLTGTVSLQGLTPGTNSHQVGLEVKLFPLGMTDPVAAFPATTDVNGNFSISGLPLGVYDVEAKEPRRLGRIARNVNILSGVN